MASSSSNPSRSHWLWIPSLYFSEGLPYVVVMTVSVIMYKKLGVSNTEIALYTSWLYLPWVIKPFWSPLVDVLRTKRWWIVAMQLLIGGSLAGVALTIPVDNFLQYTLAFLWLMAFSSATHDIAADGFYMLPLSSHEQAWFVGIRSTFYRLAMITGQGLLVMLAGSLETANGLPEQSITVRAETDATRTTEFVPADLGKSGKDELPRILIASDSYELSLNGRSPQEIQAIVLQVRQWNVEHAFYKIEKTEQDTQASTTEKNAWLENLENWIVDQFGENELEISPSALAGDIAIVQMQFSGSIEKGQSRVVNLSRGKGDPSFNIIEGARFKITPENADAPFAAVVQVDHRLKEPAEATFSALSGDTPKAWKMTFLLAAGFFLAVCLWHMIALPRPEGESAMNSPGITETAREFLVPIGSFFQKKGAVSAIIFLMLYRFSEAQLVKLSSPFLLDGREVGGLSLSTGEVGFAYGTVGIVALTVGGILGGIVAAKQGLKFWLWWMVLAMNLPNAVYVFLSQIQPESYLTVNIAVAVEQFGYGFGFTAYMLFMLYVSRGEHETAHYAICTGFMALGMMLPGMFSGWLQELIGYQHFFIWVMIATVPSFLVCWLVDIDPGFGKEEVEPEQ